MADERSAHCHICGKRIVLNRDGNFRPHGRPANRCLASGEAPAEGVKIFRTERSFYNTHGKCSRCGDTKRLKKDGTVYRHYDARDLPRRPQQGWCPGSDEKPKES